MKTVFTKMFASLSLVTVLTSTMGVSFAQQEIATDDWFTSTPYTGTITNNSWDTVYQPSTANVDTSWSNFGSTGSGFTQTANSDWFTSTPYTGTITNNSWDTVYQPSTANVDTGCLNCYTGVTNWSSYGSSGSGVTQTANSDWFTSTPYTGTVTNTSWDPVYQPSVATVNTGCMNCSTGVTNWTNYGTTGTGVSTVGSGASTVSTGYATVGTYGTVSTIPSSSFTGSVSYNTPSYSTYSPVSYGATSYGYTTYGGGTTNSTVNCPTGYVQSGYSCIRQVTTTSPTTTTTSCPTGTAWNGSTCVVNTVTCQSGSTLVNGVCVVNTTSCPTGSSLVNGVCTITSRTCATGTTWNGSACVYPSTCSNGTTWNGSTCVAPSTCPTGSSLVNGVCTIGTTSCPTGSSLVNGVCTINSRTCASGSTWNGSYCVAPTTCASGTTWNGTSCVAPTTCASGTTWNGSSCIAPTTCPTGSSLINGVCTLHTATCPTGSSLVNGVCTVNTTSCPNGTSFVNGVCTVQTVSCPTGSSLVNGVCTINSAVCPTGSSLYNGVCTVNQSYQTCWDGSRIPTSQACPAQYKTCPNGSTIFVTQTCPVVVVRPPVTQVSFNNVVTSVVTNITKNSARCNGIGLIANNAASTGWFEWGTTPNLGYTTSVVAIGSSASAPFSNVISGLTPRQTYYCRAVMNNSYGTVKGEIVQFTTKNVETVYVQPVTPVKPTKTPTPPRSKDNEVLCSDGTILKTSSKETADLLANGSKLVTLSLSKVSGDTSVSGDATYRLVYKNVSGATLSNVSFKIVIPAELTVVASQAGVYDQNARAIVLTVPSLPASAEGLVEFKLRTGTNAVVGKSVVVTAYSNYAVVGTNGASASDEVTTYLISTITPANGTISALNQDTQNGQSSMNQSDRDTTGGVLDAILPGTLVEWIALIAIIFIIFIIGRSIFGIVSEGGHH